ncbi:hypothetical protein CHS0354_042369 [Potamilus streckersoni]|uniref:Uncharacterized protein n=1 Tax=Potamilus streckersoni TaxID=2493646 RepID=A0AAE0STW9_9BIVA|nr:hypothetical protein CHS0354_042369 [Potamilus streckersoni]
MESRTDDSTTASLNSTSMLSILPENQGPFHIDSVIIILWGLGGVLLVTLIVLMGCVLRAHKKGRHPLHARQGLFYTRTSGACPPHGGVNPSFTSYDDIWTWIPVITQNTCVNGNINPAEQDTDGGQGNTTIPPTYDEAINEQSNRTEISAPLNRQMTSTPIEHHYETIQVREISANPRMPNPMTNVNSNVPNTNPRSSALRPSVQSPLPNRSVQPSTDQNERHGRSLLQQETHDSESHNERRSSYRIYHQYPRSDQRHSERIYEGQNRADRNLRFTHSDSSMFTYYTGHNGRRVYCDVPPSLYDEDGPPPYSHRHTRNVRNAPVVRMDYNYF